MKANILTLLLLSLVCFSAQAQDDDMYFMSSKKKAQKTAPARVSSATVYNDADDEADADYHIGQLRDVDEYNRRGSVQADDAPSIRLEGDTLYVDSKQSAKHDAITYNEGYSDGYYDGLYDGDFTYTARLARYRGFRLYDPFIWDITFGWYDPWYDPWYGWYRPYYGYSSWGWGWHNYGWYGGWYRIL